MREYRKKSILYATHSYLHSASPPLKGVKTLLLIRWVSSVGAIMKRRHELLRNSTIDDGGGYRQSRLLWFSYGTAGNRRSLNTNHYVPFHGMQ